MSGNIFAFDQYLLDEAERRLQKDGVEVQLPPRVFDVLCVLVKRHGNLVRYDELMDAVWGDTFVEEGNLRYSIHSLRKALGSGIVETVAKKGYRFAADVKAIGREEFIADHVGGTFPPEASPKSLKIQASPDTSFRHWLALSLVFGCLVLVAAVFLLTTGPNAASADPLPLLKLSVEPFEVITGNAEQEAAVQRGIATSLAFNLNRIRGLQAVQADRAGESAKADEILSGTVRFEGHVARVVVQLASPSGGDPLFARSFTVEPLDGIGTEEAIALQIARQIDVRIVAKRDERLVADPSIDEETRQLFLLSQRIPSESDLNRWPEVIELLERVTERQPTWAIGFAKLAEAMVLAREGRPCDEVIGVANKALTLDIKSADAHFVIGKCFAAELNWDQAESSFRRAIDSDPNNSRVYFEYGAVLDNQRRFAEAEIRLLRGLELEPFSPFYNFLVARHFLYDKNWDEAIRYSNRTLAIEPGYFLAGKNLYWIYVNQGRYDLVEEVAYPNLSREQRAKHPVARYLAAKDVPGYWRALIAERAAKGDTQQNPVTFAIYHTLAGENEAAFAELVRANDESSTERPRMNVDPAFDALRSDPRFGQLTARIGLRSDGSFEDSNRTIVE